MLDKYTTEGIRDYVKVWIRQLRERIEDHNEKVREAAAAATAAPNAERKPAKGMKKRKTKKDGAAAPEPPLGEPPLEPASTGGLDRAFFPPGAGMGLGIGLGIALRAVQPSSALVLMNQRRTVLTRTSLAEIQPQGEPASSPPGPDGSGKKSPETGSSGWGGRAPSATSKGAEKHPNGDVPEKSMKEMVSNVRYLIAQNDGMKSARTIILILIVSIVILILFVLYLFNEVSAIKAALQQLHPELIL